MNLDIKKLSKVASDLAIAINALAACENTIGISSSRVVSVFESTMALLEKEINKLGVSDSQLSLDLKETKVNAPSQNVKTKEETTEIKTTLNVVKKDPVVEPAKVVVSEEKKVEPVAQIPAPEKKEETITADKAMEIVSKAAYLVLKNNKGNNVSPESEAAIKTAIANIYAKVHPQTQFTEGSEDLNALYLKEVLPTAIATLKKEGIEVIKAENKKLDEVDDILKGIEEGVVIEKATAPVVEQKTTVIPTAAVEKELEVLNEDVVDEANTESTEEETTATLVTEANTEEEMVNDNILIDPEATADSLKTEKKTSDIEAIAEQIFKVKFNGDAAARVKTENKEYTFKDYMIPVLKKLRNKTKIENSDKSNLIPWNNSAINLKVKEWENTWSNQKAS